VSGEWSYEFSAVKAASGLVIKARSYFDRVIATLGDGEPVIVTVAKPVDRRSLQQNRALWGPIYDQIIHGICQKQGIARGDELSKYWLHEGLLQKFGGTVKDPITGCEVAKERSSTMSASRFCEFMEWIAMYAAEEHQVVVTLPGEQ
jgi:hypothetical protein